MSAAATRGATRKKERSAQDRAVTAIAKKEFMEYTRRPWILALAGIFVVLTLLGSAATGRGEGVESFVQTLGAIRSIVGLIIPLMALILAHGALAGEQEVGSLAILLTQPLTRNEVLVGKFAGLFGVLATAIVGGFGISAAVIGIRGGAIDLGDFARFLLATLLFAGAYLALFLAFSAAASRRTPALLMSIGAWVFLGFVYPLILSVFLLRLILRGATEVPGWYTVLSTVTIPNLYSNLMFATSTAFKTVVLRSEGGQFLPDFLTTSWAPAALTAGLVAWTLAGLGVAWWFLSRKDV